MPLSLLALYFIHAFYMTFPMTAYGEWLFDVLHMPPATTTLYYSVTFFPWNIKPLYGLLSDSLPLFGYRRKSYIIICEVCAATSLVLTAAYVHSIAGAFIVKLVDAIAEAFAQLMLGILLVDLTTGDATSRSSAHVQSLANGTKNAASIAALVLGVPVYMNKNIKPQQVIGWTSLLPLTAGAVCLLGLKETPVYEFLTSEEERSIEVDRLIPASSWANTLTSWWLPFKHDLHLKMELIRPVLPPMLFFFLCNALPSDGTIWYQYTFSLLKDEHECVQYMSMAGMIGRFLSCLSYAKWCTNKNVRSVFLLSTLCSVAAGLPRLLLAPPVVDLPVSVCTFSTVETFLTSFTSEFALLQLLVVATYYCPASPDVQGLTYALFLSFMDFGGVVSGILSSFLVSALGIVPDSTTKIVDWRNLWLVVAIASVGQLLVLVFLGVLPEKVDTSESTSAAGDRSKRKSILMLPDEPEKQPLLLEPEAYADVRV
ncbi:folate-Biopterin Transporter (FBT) family [Phytophthora infestans T30-4]|uniref:Folate-Biopterin Transporter (FBT) family n=1 Tax=Phytophthora infestans (strain T30-4) TaxID=403677 RepID=D0N259_PHYIT|nr:folate-Biopterin Transporter (FBT) family [Phytophthora infestans T30-4]EEY68388.1 folate-Biopterin Transporter (FBT) family [Phytophthora infestans T30-4]|eukprot:XP_002905547.1 folate-Biopterin Transporter (FBT) family [Phytophthora infestans T30-4]